VCTTNFFPSCQLDCDTIHTPREILNSYPLIPYIFKTENQHELISEVNLHAVLLCVGYTWYDMKTFIKTIINRNNIIYSEYPSPVKFLHSGSLMQPTANLNSVVQDTNSSAPRSLQIVNCFTTIDPTGFPHSKNASIVVQLSGLLKPILSKPEAGRNRENSPGYGQRSLCEGCRWP